MNKRIIASLTLFSFLSLSTPMIAAPQADNALSSAGVTVEASKGEILHRGNSVKVGESSEMTLLMPSGTRVKVAPQSEFRVSTSADGQPEIYLLTGRLMTAVNGPVTVKTYRSNAVASAGEFILETNPDGTGLRVLSGNAQLKSNFDEEVTFDRLGSLPGDIAQNASLAFNKLAADQISGDFQFGAQGKGKGKGQGVRDSDDEDNTGGTGEVSPDQDVRPPGQEPVVETPPETAPPVSETPPTTPPTTPPVETAAAGGGGGSVLPYVLGGLGLAGLILLITNDSDDDDIFVPVPSPSLP